MANKKQRRKYYITFKAKKQGFEFKKEGKTRIMHVLVNNGDLQSTLQNKYVQALINEFQFGLQIINPLMS